MRKFNPVLFALVLAALACLGVSSSASAEIDQVLQQAQTQQIASESSETEIAIKDAEEAIRQNDNEKLLDKLEKMLAKIKELDPNIDSLPVEITKKFESAETDEVERMGKFVKFTRTKNFRKAFLRAHKLYESGSLEVAFKSFRRLYEEYNYNRKALYFMILCEAKQKKLKQAVELAEELLEIIKRAGEVAELREELGRDFDRWEGDTAENKLGKESIEVMTKKLDKIMVKINKMMPSIANIPDKIEKPKIDRKASVLENMRVLYNYQKNCEHLADMKEAKKLFDEKKYDEAFEKFNAVYEDNAMKRRALYYMALCEMNSGRPDRAARITSRLLGLMKNWKEIRDTRNDIDEDINPGKHKGDKKGDKDKKDKKDKKSEGAKG